uniref:Eukaryotic translation initiation factor 3 subunit C n=1 Tax=Chrysemys picta bellii TaxID=8478 RepID=A0A8C3P4A9_CHRPI
SPHGFPILPCSPGLHFLSFGNRVMRPMRASVSPNRGGGLDPLLTRCGRRFEELTNLIKTIRNAMKIRDVTKCLEEFELLGKAYGKAKSIVDKEGVPRFYVRILADLEQYLNELWEDKEGKKKMNKNNAKALSTLRQKIRKYNRDYESQISSYRQVPGGAGGSSSSEDDDDGEGMSAAAFLKKKEPSGDSRSKFLKKMEVRALPGVRGGGGIAHVWQFPPEMWKKCLESIDELLDMLFANPNIFIGENILEESENLSNFEQPLRVRGCILTLVERMDEEFTKIMQNTDPHSQEYVDHLKDEGRVCGIIGRVQSYLQEKGTTEEICRGYLRRVLHTYYKFDYKAHQREQGPAGDSKVLTPPTPLSAAVGRRGAVGGRPWGGAGRLSPLSPQILYNRTMVQLGICAFRQGMTKDAHNALLDIQSSGRAKELLGQGLLMRSLQERNQEQEKIEKRRQVPFHMHINLELLECVYLVSAMLLEIPYMAAHEFDARRRMISKQFHHQLRVGERQPLLGPPESMREHVVAASKAMKMGDWRTCHRFIINEKMNGKVWDLFPEADKVRTMLVRKIQEESLRTYLFTYSSVYDSISMEILSDMFQLDLPTVHSIISKMIINEELMASLDQPTQTVVMHRTEPTALQNMALQLAEKLGNLVENNERVFDHKQGTYGGYFRDQKDGYRKNEGGYMRRGGYRQQERQANY